LIAGLFDADLLLHLFGFYFELLLFWLLMSAVLLSFDVLCGLFF